MKLPDVVTIPRDKWIRHSYGDGYGNHCALGWLAFEVTGQHWVNDENANDNEAVAFLFDLDWDGHVTGANDHLFGDERETALRELFAKQGVQLRFVGEYKLTSEKSAAATPIMSAASRGTSAEAIATPDLLFCLDPIEKSSPEPARRPGPALSEAK